jgi:pyruvate dehydrogenase E2 component (dihydrolipoamide acetyltransferase)
VTPSRCPSSRSSARRWSRCSEVPSLNANFDDAAQELVQRGSFNFGIAAATEEGLTVPVVKDVDRLTVRQLAEEILRLAAGPATRP